MRRKKFVERLISGFLPDYRWVYADLIHGTKVRIRGVTGGVGRPVYRFRRSNVINSQKTPCYILFRPG